MQKKEDPQETKVTTHKSEGIVDVIKAILKKSVDVPNEVMELAKSMRILAEEVRDMSSVVSALSQVVYQHSNAIKDLYTAHALILKKLKSDVEPVGFPSIDKDKAEKPN